MARETQRARRGSAAMEFSLWLFPLFILISGVVDWGYYMTQRVNVARATMDGCRIGAAVFEPNGMTAGSLSTVRARNRTINVLNGLGMPCGGSCTVNAQYCRDGTGGACENPPFDALLVTVTYDFTPFFGFASTPTQITESFMMASENQREPD